MERIIIVGHGSPRQGANTIETVCTLLHASIHPGCSHACVKAAYLEFAEPGIMRAIEQCVSEGAAKIIIHPFFLAAGVHVTKDIPDVIEDARRRFVAVDFVYSEPLGIHDKLIEIVRERIGYTEKLKPEEIEPESFSLINQEVDFSSIPDIQQAIVRRVVHATADFEFARTLIFHPDAIAAGIAAIRAGKDIVTDVEMVRTGINKKALAKFGGRVHCCIPEGSHAHSRHETKTRAEQGIETAMATEGNIGIFAIGNAPTALLRTIELLKERRDVLVVGVPVGFVKAFESKNLLSRQVFPFISNLSKKGGSSVAAAIVNALIKMAEGEAIR
ncbi:MAG TPA: precorrin-8X methylmutase [Dissulfurispiraceae bacterium]|nr:precorrin-8X methylmutase [Dissulfurispiraceae bacterium]